MIIDSVFFKQPISLFKETSLSSLRDLHKKIFIIVSLALGSVVACYFISYYTRKLWSCRVKKIVNKANVNTTKIKKVEKANIKSIDKATSKEEPKHKVNANKKNPQISKKNQQEKIKKNQLNDDEILISTFPLKKIVSTKDAVSSKNSLDTEVEKRVNPNSALTRENLLSRAKKVKRSRKDVEEEEGEEIELNVQKKVIHSNGAVVEGIFKNNQLQGKGKIIFKTGESFEGYFKNGEINGPGKFSFPNGELREIYWS